MKIKIGIQLRKNIFLKIGTEKATKLNVCVVFKGIHSNIIS